jgi:hypothetical protein
MWRRSALLIATLTLGAGVASWTQSAGSPQGTAEGLPPGPMQAKATTACMECHDARIILQQRLSKAAWGREVDKMTKWGALVEQNDRDPLIDYLSANFGTERSSYQPPRLATTKQQTKHSRSDPQRHKTTQP